MPRRASNNHVEVTVRKRGGQWFVPTKQQRQHVEAMAGFGITHEDISRLVISPRTNEGIDTKTLREAFRKELDAGHVKANSKVGQSLFQQATGGGDWTKANVAATIWWTKSRMGWRGDREDGAQVNIGIVIRQDDARL